MWGWIHKLAECSKILWKETAKSLRDIRIHFSYEMPHDTECKQIICMWGKKKTTVSLQLEVGGCRTFETNASTNTPHFPVCHVKPLLQTSWKRKLLGFHLVLMSECPKLFLCDFRANAWAHPIPSTPLPILLHVTQLLCIIHQPLHMHRVEWPLAFQLHP